MNAMFGLGWGEIVVLGLIAVLLFGVPLIVIFGVLPSLRKSAPAPHRHDEIVDLRAQIAELRDEVERLKKGLHKRASLNGIIADGPNYTSRGQD